MKKFALFVIALGLFSSYAQGGVEEKLAHICEVVKTDDKGALRRKMKEVREEYNMKLTFYYEGITCGGSSLIQYAVANKSEKVGKLLVKKLSKRVLIEQGYPQWAMEEGELMNPIIVAVRERTGE